MTTHVITVLKNFRVTFQNSLYKKGQSFEAEKKDVNSNLIGLADAGIISAVPPFATDAKSLSEYESNLDTDPLYEHFNNIPTTIEGINTNISDLESDVEDLQGDVNAIKSGSIHPPVQAVPALKGILDANRADKVLCLVEDKEATYRFDAESVSVADADLIVIPDDVTAPAPGRWHKMGAGGGAGATMKDLAPAGYDYYILSDGSGDNVSAEAGLAAVLGLGAGHYRVYVGPGDFTMNWTTAWPANVSLIIHGAGMDQTRLIAAAASTQPLGGYGVNTGVYEMAHLTWETQEDSQSYSGRIIMNNGGPTVSAPATLSDGTHAPGCIHNCRLLCTAATGSQIVFLNHSTMRDCELHTTGMALGGSVNGIIESSDGSFINCNFRSSGPGTFIFAGDRTHVDGCSFLMDGSDGGAFDKAIRLTSGSMMVSGCDFVTKTAAQMILISAGTTSVFSDNSFSTAQGSTFNILGGAPVTRSRNLYSGGVIDTA